MIRRKSDRFMRCHQCGGAIRPRDQYLWDEDTDEVTCLTCDEAYWESLFATMPPEGFEEHYGEDITWRLGK